ncbi:MarR family transcriptional regulator [Jeotgalibacillus proteolyticus]|uniref:MarR family transcriptional regulator n=1 Tax=Jeotgalibacillus proteolyticus TaxID=2082395 RepID=A0A2S5GFM9_9BACL|nr:MarR family transcriptional regulator [Jeotgalibacillus proteolyticus]PPA71721.1 MarR family transcriptional regulator [Jeotgalibacillus proteolyticus]
MKLSFQDYISIKIHKTDLLLTGFIKSRLEPYNLAPEQNLIMMLLWERDGLTQNQMVQMLNKDKTNIARMASNLEKKGFIKRSQSEEDKRVIQIFLTSEGKKLGDKIIPIAEQFNELVCKGLSEEELTELERLLSKMSSNIQSE